MNKNEKIKNVDEKFSRTNQNTILDRIKIIKKLIPNAKKIAELCCGDCRFQNEFYKNILGIKNYIGIDLDERIIRLLKKNEIDCFQGDVMDPAVLKKILDFDILFFGPPLSKDCIGHDFFRFEEIRPSYLDFLSLIYIDLQFQGTVVCICPKSTSMGDIRSLYQRLRLKVVDVNLRLINLSISNMTGKGDVTKPRLKYIELWFSRTLADAWEINPVHEAHLIK